MDAALIKQFFDCCHFARKILELMPPLPEGMTPRHIRIIDVISQLEDAGSPVRVSDISAALKATRPSVTRLVAELAALGVLTKTASPTDGRVTYVQLTKKGRGYYDFYVKKYHAWVGAHLTGVEPDDVAATARTFKQFYAALKNNPAPKP